MPTTPSLQKHHRNFGAFAKTLAFGALLVLPLGLGSTGLFAQPLTPNVVPPPDDARLLSERNSIDVFRAVAPATVFVTQTRIVRDWTMRPSEVNAGEGTGFLWDRQGHIVTNFHVIKGANAVQVTLHSRKTYNATLVGVEPRKDIAVLKVDAPPAELTSVRLLPPGERIEVGQKALAIGNPFGLDHTLTVGVVSALGREVAGIGGVTIRDMVQTDAAINPGNSGGPLLDSQGRLIGMNTMIFSKSGSSAGIGFAVPVSTVRRVVNQIITTGRAEQLGIGATYLDDDIARRSRVRGVIISKVLKGTPAAKARLRGVRRTRRGLLLGDVIVAIDGQGVVTYDDLYTAFDSRQKGEKVKVTIVRDGEAFDVVLPLVVVN